jgi:hypothetical protein
MLSIPRFINMGCFRYIPLTNIFPKHVNVRPRPTYFFFLAFASRISFISTFSFDICA